MITSSPDDEHDPKNVTRTTLGAVHPEMTATFSERITYRPPREPVLTRRYYRRNNRLDAVAPDAGQRKRCMMCMSTSPWTACRKPRGTVPTMMKPRERHRFSDAMLVVTTALNCIAR